MKTIVIPDARKTPIVISESDTQIYFTDDGCIYTNLDPVFSGITIDCSKQKIDNVHIYGARISQCANGIVSVGDIGISGLLIENTSCYGNSGSGIKIDCCWDGTIRNTRCWHNDNIGIDLKGSHNVHCDIGVANNRIGFIPADMSQNRVTSQMNVENDIVMFMSQHAHIQPGSYFEDRPDSDSSYPGYGLHATNCSDCSIDIPIIQRGHWFEACTDCDVTFRDQRSATPRTDTWRWQAKPAVSITRCNGGLWRWARNGSVEINSSSFKQHVMDTNNVGMLLRTKIAQPLTVCIRASASRGGRIRLGGEYFVFPSKQMATVTLYCPEGAALDDYDDDVVIDRAIYLPGRRGLADFYVY